MRRMVLPALLSLWLLVAATGANAAVVHTKATKATSDVIVTHWHQVASGLSFASGDPVTAASSGYLALRTKQDSMTLLNTTTNHKTLLSPPDCQNPDGSVFGGPWLAVDCSVSSTNASGATSYVPFVDLLNLSTGQWTPHLLDPQMCQTAEVGCDLSGVGSTWLRFSTAPFDYHDPTPTYLQNIATGAVKNDLYSAPPPTAPQDNLNNASGFSHPCAKLPTPALDENFLGTTYGQGNEAYFSQLGRFVLTTGINGETETFPDVLQACGSSKRITLPEDLMASSDIVLWPKPGSGSNQRVTGLVLPALRSVTIRDNKGSLAAVSNHTVYETDYDKTTAAFDLWATSVPKSTLTKSG
jgi:hypothetical protein